VLNLLNKIKCEKQYIYVNIFVYFEGINHVFENADPKEYVTKYGASLLRPSDIPAYADIEQPTLEASLSKRLIGDIEALRVLDPVILDREGLAQYKHYLN
jgi:hypothetical protein